MARTHLAVANNSRIACGSTRDGSATVDEARVDCPGCLEVLRHADPYPCRGACEKCRVLGVCNGCGSPVTRATRCTQGRCPRCCELVKPRCNHRGAKR